jgi:hypothetical protein
MSVVCDPREQQRLRALERANEVRLAICAVKIEVGTRQKTVGEALYDARAQAMNIVDLLIAQPRWGRKRACQLLGPHFISEGRKVRDLTERQRQLIVAALR